MMDRSCHTDSVPQGSPPLRGERVAFTGTLASMTHEQAHTLTGQHGGTATHSVSRQTTMLVIGEEGWPLESDGRPSLKLRQVNDWNNSGREIRVVNESDWLSLIGLSPRRDELRGSYTPAMLSTLLNLPAGVFRRWERLGLIRAVRKIHRLPYFDYQEVSGARRLSGLLKGGASPRELETSLTRLTGLVDGVERSLAQLNLLVRDRYVVVRDDRGLVNATNGQRLFDFEPNPALEDDDGPPALPFPRQADGPGVQLHWSSSDWFHEGCRLVDDNRPVDAVEAFRLALTTECEIASLPAPRELADEIPSLPRAPADKPHPAEINFHLAETLYRLGRLEAAIERYYCVVELDPQYLEAWTQLGCLLAESQSYSAAIDAFRIALDLHPQYPDAHWHMGNLLDQLGRGDEALQHWRPCLEFDRHGPWAETARQRLGLRGSEFSDEESQE